MDPPCDAMPISLEIFSIILSFLFSPLDYFLLFVLPSEVSRWDRFRLKYIYAVPDAPILLPVLFGLLTYEMAFWIFPSVILHSSKFTELESKPVVSFWGGTLVFPATNDYMTYELKLIFCEIPCKFIVAGSMV